MVKNTLKKFFVFLMIGFVALPVSAVQASHTTLSDVIENTLAADAFDMSIDVDVQTDHADLDQPISLHAGADVMSDGNANVQLDYEFWATDDSGDFTQVGGVLKIVDGVVYFSEDGTTWSILAEDVIAEEMESEDVSEQAEVLAAGLEDLINRGVITYRAESAEVIDGTMTMRYGYSVDTDRLVDYMIEEDMLPQEKELEVTEYLDQNVTVGGKFWIDTAEMLPKMATLNIAVSEENGTSTTVDFTLFFTSLNEDVEITTPSRVITTSYDQFEDDGNVVLASVENAMFAIDADHDGLTNDQETQIWNSNPFDEDSDSDGYSDYTEVINGYNPNGKGKLDSDGDGLTDYAEMTIHWSDRYDSDSDNDGYADGVEIAHGYDPNGPGRF